MILVCIMYDIDIYIYIYDALIHYLLNKWNDWILIKIIDVYNFIKNLIYFIYLSKNKLITIKIYN